MAIDINATNQIVEINENSQVVEINTTSPIVEINATSQVVEINASSGIIEYDPVNLITNVRNQTGSTIAKFKVVYISGATGNKPLITLASNLTEAASSKTYGLTRDTIANNGTGYVVTVGELRNVDTSAFNEGDQLWLGTNGNVLTAPPAEPAHAVFIGFIVRSHPILGVVDVRIQNGYELNEIHGVEITNPTNNQVLKYNSTTGLWINSSDLDTGITTINSLTATTQNFATGTSGTDFNITSTIATHTFNIPNASSINRGLLTTTDWTTFNDKQSAISLTTTGSSGSSTFIGNTLNIPTYTISGLGGVPTTRTLTINGTALDLSADRSWNVGTVTSVAMSVPTGFAIGGIPITSSGTLALSFASGYSLPTTASQTNWDAAYNDKINSASVSGTTTKTLTLTQQDGGTITASWTDDNTDAVTSVFGRTGAVVATEGDYNLTQLGDVTITTPSNGQVLKYNGTSWINDTGYVGTVTSVGLSVPTGLSVSGSPITTSGTLAISLTAGYSIPTTTKQSEWDSAYNDKINSAAVTGTTTKTLTLSQQDGGTITASWSDIDTSGITSLNGLTATTQTFANDTNVTITSATSTHTIGWSGQLAISRGGTGLSALGTAGQLLRVNTGATALEYFTPTYISGNQTITISGDASGSGTTAITLTLATVNSNVGTFNNVTVNAKGLVTAASNVAYLTANQSITWTAAGDVSGTASGATSITPSLTVTGLRGVALPTLTAGGGFLKYTGTGTNTWVFDTSTYLTAAITSLNGLTAATQTFANDTNVTITSATSTHTIGWSGQLAVGRGGSGASTLTGVLIGNGTSAFTGVTGTASQYLRRNAGDTAYEFGAISGSDVTGAALTKTDDTNVTLTLGGTPATSLLRAASLTLGWTGQLSIARGGTGLSALGTANQLLRVNGGATALEYFTPTYFTLPSLTSGSVLFSNGTTIAQDNANFFWDDTNNRLGIGMQNPYAKLTTSVSGTFTTNSNDSDYSTYGLWIADANPTNAIGGAIGFGSSTGRKLAAIGAYHEADADQVGLKFYVQPTATGSSGVLTEAMYIASSGNLGLGVTPSAWSTSYKVLQLNAQSAIWGSSDAIFLSVNQFQNTSGSNRYIANGFATQYRQDGGQHQFYTAPSGTAGNAITFTQAMTLTSGGNVLVGTTTDAGYKLDITGNLRATTGIKDTRVDPRSITTTSTATLTPDVSADDFFTVTAQAASITLANPTGTPVEGQKIMVRIKDNGTSRSILYGTQYRASSDYALPTATTVSRTIYLGFIYNSIDTKWDLIAKLDNFA